MPSESFERSSGIPEHLKNDAVNLEGLYLKGTGATVANGVPNTWNENSGIIIFHDERGAPRAIPATDRVRDELFSSATKDESIGVPHLYDSDVWGGKEYANQMPTYRAWSEKEFNLRTVQQSEAEAMATAQQDATEASITANQEADSGDAGQEQIDDLTTQIKDKLP